MTRKELAEEEAMKFLANRYGTLDPMEMFVAGWLAADSYVQKIDCPDEKALERIDKFFTEAGIKTIPPGRNLERNNK